MSFLSMFWHIHILFFYCLFSWQVKTRPLAKTLNKTSVISGEIMGRTIQLTLGRSNVEWDRMNCGIFLYWHGRLIEVKSAFLSSSVQHVPLQNSPKPFLHQNNFSVLKHTSKCNCSRSTFDIEQKNTNRNTFTQTGCIKSPSPSLSSVELEGKIQPHLC